MMLPGATAVRNGAGRSAGSRQPARGSTRPIRVGVGVRAAGSRYGEAPSGPRWSLSTTHPRVRTRSPGARSARVALRATSQRLGASGYAVVPSAASWCPVRIAAGRTHCRCTPSLSASPAQSSPGSANASGSGESKPGSRV